VDDEPAPGPNDRPQPIRRVAQPAQPAQPTRERVRSSWEPVVAFLALVALVLLTVLIIVQSKKPAKASAVTPTSNNVVVPQQVETGNTEVVQAETKQVCANAQCINCVKGGFALTNSETAFNSNMSSFTTGDAHEDAAQLKLEPQKVRVIRALIESNFDDPDMENVRATARKIWDIGNFGALPIVADYALKDDRARVQENCRWYYRTYNGKGVMDKLDRATDKAEAACEMAGIKVTREPSQQVVTTRQPQAPRAEPAPVAQVQARVQDPNDPNWQHVQKLWEEYAYAKRLAEEYESMTGQSAWTKSKYASAQNAYRVAMRAQNEYLANQAR
jgi:hypothetical protein